MCGILPTSILYHTQKPMKRIIFHAAKDFIKTRQKEKAARRFSLYIIYIYSFQLISILLTIAMPRILRHFAVLYGCCTPYRSLRPIAVLSIRKSLVKTFIAAANCLTRHSPTCPKASNTSQTRWLCKIRSCCRQCRISCANIRDILRRQSP